MATLSGPPGQASSSSSSASPSTNAPPRLVAPAPRRPIALVSKQHRTLHKHSRHQSYHHSHHLAQHRGRHLHHSASASFDAGRGQRSAEAPLAEQLNAMTLLGESSQQQQHYPERVQSAGVLGYHARDEDLQGQDPSSYLDPDLTPTKARLQSMKQAMGSDNEQLLSPHAEGSKQPPLSSPLAHKSTAVPASGNLLWPGAVAMQEAVGMPLNDEHDDEMVEDDEEEQRRQLYRQQQQPQREMPGASYFAFLHSDNDDYNYHHNQEREQEQDTTSHLFQHDNATAAAASTFSTTIPHGVRHEEAAAASSTTPPATPSPSVAAGLEAARMHSAGARLPSSPISRLHTRNPFGRAASYEG